MFKFPSFAAATIALLVLGFAFPVSAQPPVMLLGQAVEGQAILKLVQFDREGCLNDCKASYGVGYGRIGPGMYYGYSDCVQRCERSFWRDFDRRAEEAEGKGKRFFGESY